MPLNSFRNWFSLFALFFVAITTSLSFDNFPLLMTHTAIGLMLVAFWLVLGGKIESGLGKSGLILAIVGLSLLAIQIVPLPPQVWKLFPGRGEFSDAVQILNVNEHWMPLSLAPAITQLDILAIVPAVGFFCWGLRMKHTERTSVAIAMVIIAVLNVMFGLSVKYFAAKSGGENSIFLNSGTVTGFFFNRNFLAALLYVSVPMLTALALHLVARNKINGYVAMLLGLLYLGLILIGLASTGSRTGIVLAMAMLVLSAFLAKGIWTTTTHKTVSSLAISGVLIGLVVIGQFGLVAVSRLAKVDAVNEQRFTMYSITSRAIAEYFPFGSGFGSFVPVYQHLERPADMIGSAYVNHAHNDWLELALEGGLPMQLLLLAFVAWFLIAATKVWRRSLTSAVDIVPRAASLVAFFLLIHSLVDYPLRAPVLMAIFAMCLGLMAAKPAPAVIARRPSQSTVTKTPLAPRAPRSTPIWPQPKPAPTSAGNS